MAIAKHFVDKESLNEDQHVAVALIDKHMDDEWVKQKEPKRMKSDGKSLQMLLLGCCAQHLWQSRGAWLGSR